MILSMSADDISLDYSGDVSHFEECPETRLGED